MNDLTDARAMGRSSGTRQQQVVDRLREWALNGTLSPDEKLSEAGLAEALGVSRTPVRHALAVLVEEGVLRRAGGRGYLVRSYDRADVVAAVELGSVLEGYAARRLAEAGLPDDVAAELDDCLRQGDALFRPGQPVEEAAYGAMNRRFHALVTDAAIRVAGVGLIAPLRATLARVPFGGPDAIRFAPSAPLARADHLRHAHWQHHYIVAALRSGEGARVESLFREHGEMVKVSLGLARGALDLGQGPPLPILR
ncbi:GntR family transcriptional regulator [Halodurantibacterium flavum]|uniref:GntR family transcriptional regulator n=1 Tax=Halodurantibacterium flavum TaxID=1382802 RepID=A0ABW4S509_9RHOB